MTIHATHPFADPDPDPGRRLRGRLGGAVSLWTAGTDEGRAGLTVSSLLVALGPQTRLLGLLDPDADLTAVLRETGRAVVQLLAWRDRELAEVFAGASPAPGGPFRQGAWIATDHGPRLASAQTWALVRLESEREVGWSTEVSVVVDQLVVGAEDEQEDGDQGAPLEHRRGRYRRVEPR